MKVLHAVVPSHSLPGDRLHRHCRDVRVVQVGAVGEDDVLKRWSARATRGRDNFTLIGSATRRWDVSGHAL
jgi:hypothetical protein